jgi:hypothetical protein
MITFWLTSSGMFLNFAGSLFLAFSAFKSKKDIVKESDFSRIAVLSNNPETKEGAEQRAQQILTPSVLRDIKKSRTGVVLLAFGFLLQFIGMFFNIPQS